MIPSPTINKITLGPISIYFYGIIIAIALLVAYKFLLKKAPHYKIDIRQLDTYFFITLPIAFIAARLYHVSVNWDVYSKNIFSVFEIWKGGIGILGGIVGGAVALYVISQRFKHKFLSVTDFFAPALALGQAIGRWGNYFNQELFGSPTNLPWALYITQENRPEQFKQVALYHPTFLYESLLNICNFAVLYWVGKKFPSYRGLVSGLYLIQYGVIRFIMELFRFDPDTSGIIGDIRYSQLFSLTFILIGMLLLVVAFKRQKDTIGS
jgi:phosphatidylglycerol:prolipoprotein diacylglycerol transferase